MHAHTHKPTVYYTLTTIIPLPPLIQVGPPGEEEEDVRAEEMMPTLDPISLHKHHQRRYTTPGSVLDIKASGSADSVKTFLSE